MSNSHTWNRWGMPLNPRRKEVSASPSHTRWGNYRGQWSHLLCSVFSSSSVLCSWYPRAYLHWNPAQISLAFVVLLPISKWSRFTLFPSFLGHTYLFHLPSPCLLSWSQHLQTLLGVISALLRWAPCSPCPALKALSGSPSSHECSKTILTLPSVSSRLGAGAGAW